jgi:hypothetical protein
LEKEEESESCYDEPESKEEALTQEIITPYVILNKTDVAVKVQRLIKKQRKNEYLGS